MRVPPHPYDSTRNRSGIRKKKDSLEEAVGIMRLVDKEYEIGNSVLSTLNCQINTESTANGYSS
jgi:hypothetical protein